MAKLQKSRFSGILQKLISLKFNKTKYTMDPGIYFLMKTNKYEIMIKVLKIAQLGLTSWFIPSLAGVKFKNTF